MTVQQPPHLQHIILKGFKSIAELDLGLGQINILIGANGAGKSNFISLFSFCSQLSQGKLQTYVEKQGGANALFHFGVKQTKSLVMDLKINVNGYHVEFSFNPNTDSLVFEQEYCTIESSTKSWFINGYQGESGLLPNVQAESHAVRQYTHSYMLNCRVYHFHDTSAQAAFKTTCRLDDNDYLQSDAANLAAFLYRLQREFPNNYRNIVTTVQAVAPFFHDFYLKPRGSESDQTLLLKWIHCEHDNPFSANQFSDGTARFICLATLFLQPSVLRPYTIILDEPELGLHPAALNVLADIIHVTAKHNQVICSTQSVTFANAFAPENFIIVDQNQGRSIFSRPDAQTLTQWLNDYRMGDIWNKNLIGGRPTW